MTNKDIIKQYVDLGTKIPEYQVDKLNTSLLKTYLRKRIIVANDCAVEYDNLIDRDEFRRMSSEEKQSAVPFIAFDKIIPGLGSKTLVMCVEKTLDFIYNTRDMPDFMLSSYSSSTCVYEIFCMFLVKYRVFGLDVINLIHEMIDCINSDSAIRSDIPIYKEIAMYLSAVDKDKIDEIAEYYKQHGATEEGYEFENDEISEIDKVVERYKRNYDRRRSEE
jgi:hypothetical protein